MRILCPLITFGLILALAPRAQAQSAEVQAYLRNNNLPSAKIQVGPANRRVQRLFVPVTQQSYVSFLNTVNEGKGYAHLNFTYSDNHLVMGLKPPTNNQATDCYLWARNYNGTVNGINDCRNMYMQWRGMSGAAPGGFVMGVKLSGSEMQHTKGWLQARNATQDRLFRTGNCMEWLSNCEVAPGKALFHRLGLKRGRDARNMKAKLLHCANNALDVVGVMVPDVNAFNNLIAQPTNLLGPPPSGGDLAAAIR